METRITSEKWNEFTRSLKDFCESQNVDFFALRDWIIASPTHFEEKDFEYYISSGPNPEEPERIISVSILLENKIFNFGLEKAKKQFFIIPVKILEYYIEDIDEDFIKCTFGATGDLTFFTYERIDRSEEVRAFVKKIQDLIWG